MTSPTLFPTALPDAPEHQAQALASVFALLDPWLCIEALERMHSTAVRPGAQREVWLAASATLRGALGIDARSTRSQA